MSFDDINQFLIVGLQGETWSKKFNLPWLYYFACVGVIRKNIDFFSTRAQKLPKYVLYKIFARKLTCQNRSNIQLIYRWNSKYKKVRIWGENTLDWATILNCYQVTFETLLCTSGFSTAITQVNIFFTRNKLAWLSAVGFSWVKHSWLFIGGTMYTNFFVPSIGNSYSVTWK